VLPTIVETKRNLDGTTERFECRLLHRDDEYLALCYLSDRPYVVAGAVLPEGSLTIGHYWRAGDYVVWEMYNPCAGLQGYYIHICRNVTFGKRSVEWEDMVVDVWVGANGKPMVLDEDELERSVQAGRIRAPEERSVRDSARKVCAAASGIARELKRFDPNDLLAAL
jgi:predicted RNA-binding protein associated with RNAse of E/G family